MPDSVRKVEHFSVVVPDKPGEAFRVLQVLVSAGVNMLACSARAAGGRAEIKVVPEDAASFQAAVQGAGLAFAATRSGFLIQGEDRPGALAEHLQRLAKAQINVAGIDAVGAGQDRWGAIVWVRPEDVGRAARALGA